MTGNVQPYMTLSDAWQLVAAKVEDLNRRQLSCALPPLVDLTDKERLFEIRARLNMIEADGPTVDLLAAIGAHLVAFIRATHARETFDVTSGSETTDVLLLSRAARTPAPGKDAA